MFLMYGSNLVKIGLIFLPAAKFYSSHSENAFLKMSQSYWSVKSFFFFFHISLISFVDQQLARNQGGLEE